MDSGYFGTLPAQATSQNVQIAAGHSIASNATQSARQNDDSIPKMKRTACVLCRKRKLRCDGTRPSCATCSRLGHECHYDEVRKKSGPKRGYVKALEARLAQVETMLKTQDSSDLPQDEPASAADDYDFLAQNDSADAPAVAPETVNMANSDDFMDLESPPLNMGQSAPQQPFTAYMPPPHPIDESSFSFELISLGLEEPLPAQDMINELHDIYFSKVHTWMPLLHRARYLGSPNVAPRAAPPICLRYAVWANAASVSPRHQNYGEVFYRRARKYLEQDEMRGFGEGCVSTSHCQTSILVSIYEFKHMYFPRAWLSAGRSSRLAQLLGFQRLDSVGADMKQTLPPPSDWVEREERRRAFWSCYWADRCASLGTGWPMVFDEKDIMTNLPASEQAYQNCQPEPTSTLQEAINAKFVGYSSFTGAILICTLFGRNLVHLHRPDDDDNDGDLNGKFWQRHRGIDDILLNVSMSMPDHLRVPQGLPDPNVIFLNMCIHTSAICLHQAAIFKAEKRRLPNSVLMESKLRCMAAATEITSIMRSVSHYDQSSLNPFSAFCLYVAARVFVQYLYANSKDQQITSSLYFMLSAMRAMKAKNPLTESFLAQLEVDMIAAGVRDPNPQSNLRYETLLKKLSSESAARGESDLNPINRHCPASTFFEVEEAMLPPAPVESEADSPGLFTIRHMNRPLNLPTEGASSLPPGGKLPDLAFPTRADDDTTAGTPGRQYNIPVIDAMPHFRKAAYRWGSDSSVVEIDRSPETSNSTPTSARASNSNVSSKGSYTIPTSDPSSADLQSRAGQLQTDTMDASVGNNQLNGNSFASSSAFSPSTLNESMAGMDAQFPPPTPGTSAQISNLMAWDFRGNSTGMTPGGDLSAESWNEMIESIGGWEGQVQ